MGKSTEDWFAPIVTNQVALTTSKVGMTLVESLRYRQDRDDLREQLTHRLEGYVLTQRLAGSEHEVTMAYEVPASGWDQFKAAQVEATSPFWRWVARRWPARMVVRTATRTISFKQEAMFPQADIAIRNDRLGLPVIFESVEQEHRRVEAWGR